MYHMGLFVQITGEGIIMSRIQRKIGVQGTIYKQIEGTIQ